MDNEVEETDISLVTPEAIKPRETRRNSTGKVNTRSSPSLLSSEEKLLPHYLRASTSSCHDFCKYGRKHEFDPKKRHPIRPKLLGNNEARDKEQNQAKASSLPKKRNKPDLKPKDTLPKDRLSEPELLNQNGPSPLQEIRLSETFTHPAEGFYEEPAIMPSPTQESLAYLENAPSADGEGSSEELISIKLVISSKEDEVLSEEPVNLKLETPSPIQKSTTDEHEHTSLTWPEGSSDGSESMELETPFATQENIEFSEHLTSVNQIEGSSEEAADSKLMASSAVLGSIAPGDEPTSMNLKAQPSIRKSIISEGPTNVKLKAQTPTRKSIGSTTLTSATRAEKSSREALNKKMNIPSPVSKRLSSVGANQEEESSLEKNQVKSLNIGGRKKREEIKLKSAAKEKTVVAESRRKAIRQKKSEVTGESNVMQMNTPLPTEKTIKIVKPKIMEQKSLSSVKKAIASVSPKISRQKASSPIKRTGIPANPSTPLKPRTATTKSASIFISSARKTTGGKLIRSMDLSKMGERKVLKPVRTSVSPKTPSNGVSSNTLRKHKIPKSVSPVKNQAKAGKVEHSSEKVKEKTLYVIEPKPPSIIPKIVKLKSRKKMLYPSSQSSSSTSVSSPSSVSSHEKVELECIESTMNEAGQLVPVSEGTKRSKPSCFPKGEVKRKPSRTTVNSEHKSPTPHKVKFRSGKVVSPQPENNGLRKLRFKQPKGTSENQNGKGEAGKKNYRKSRESVAAHLNPPSEEAPTVVLRHQDVQEKKDTQGLLNNVIEETASKLVETRKSKVKALVGAFETVISLQERKIAPTI